MYLLSGATGDFRSYILSTVVPRVTTRLGSCYASLLRICLSELRRGRSRTTASPPFESLRHLYSSLSGLGAITPPRHIDEVHRLDPLSRAARYIPGDRVTPEMRFLRSGLSRLERGDADSWLERIFWQIVRVRGAFYRHVVQRPLTPGLPWFIRYFDRLRPARGWWGGQLRVQSALAVSGDCDPWKCAPLRRNPNTN
jgi:hypothetical protein